MKKVLVVDDAMFMRKLLTNILEKEGYQVVGEAANGAEAFTKYEELMPDLVTMDITMPEVTGIEGLRMIMEKFPDAKILMCTAMGQESMVVESIKAGAKGFIVKPFQPDKVISSVRDILKE